MKMPWLTIRGRSPQAPASSACFSLRTLATAVLEGLAEHQLADVVELLRLEADGGADGAGCFPRPNHVAAEQARYAGPPERVSGQLGLATAELGEAVAFEVGERLLATMGVVGGLAVAEEQGSLGHCRDQADWVAMAGAQEASSLSAGMSRRRLANAIPPSMQRQPEEDER